MFLLLPACSADGLLLSPEVGMTSGPQCPPGFKMGNVDLNSGPQGCVASALTTEPSSPLPQMRILPLKVRETMGAGVNRLCFPKCFYKKS